MSYRRGTCPTCGSTDAEFFDDACWPCQYWNQELATPGGLIIDGRHYRIGGEPTPDDLPSRRDFLGFGGHAFTIRLADGTAVVTHNLWSQGQIPPGLTRPDTATFTGDPEAGQ